MKDITMEKLFETIKAQAEEIAVLKDTTMEKLFETIQAQAEEIAVLETKIRHLQWDVSYWKQEHEEEEEKYVRKVHSM